MQFKLVIRGGQSTNIPDQLREWSQETGYAIQMSMVPWEGTEMALAIFFNTRDEIMGMAALALLMRRVKETQPEKEVRPLIEGLSPEKYRDRRITARLRR
jgi:hypothetical protein